MDEVGHIQSILNLFFSGRELYREDIELLCKEFRTNIKLDGYDYSEHCDFVTFHFGSVTTEFQQQFKNMYNCVNEIEYIITEDLMSIHITFNDKIIKIG